MTVSNQPRQPSGALTPLVAFAALLVLMAAGAAYLLTRPTDEAPTPPGSPVTASPSSTDQALTDAEAIARMAQIDKVRIRSLEQKNFELLETVVAPASPALRRLSRSIRSLIKDDVRLVQRLHEVLRASVLSKSSGEIRVKQTVRVDIQFEDARGVRLTKGTGKEVQVLISTLRNVGGEWLFFDGEIVRAEALAK